MQDLEGEAAGAGQALGNQLQAIMDAVGEAIVVTGVDGGISSANRMACQLLGRRPDELIGSSFWHLVQPDGNGSHGGPPRTVGDETFLRADGSEFPVEYHMAPLREQDQVVGAVLVFRDVTLCKRYEQALADNQRELERQVAERAAGLRASQGRLQGIADSLFEAVLVVDDGGYVVFANRSAARLLLQQADDEPVGRHLDDLLFVGRPSCVIPFSDGPFREVARGATAFRDDDAQFFTPWGKALAVAYACSALEEDAGHRLAIISFRDIGALKAAQREAMQSSRLASVGQLAAGIAHEINTPIQYVGDNLHFLGDSFRDLGNLIKAGRALAQRARGRAGLTELAEAFDRLAEAADLDYLESELPKAIVQSLDGVGQVSRIILSMKEFSHPGAPSKVTTDIARAIENTLVVSRNAWKHAAIVYTDFARELPAVPCYPGEINQVFLNLLVNAAHAIEASGKPLPGTIRISTRRAGNGIEISFADNGTGVPAAMRDRIFDPFFTTKAVGKGTGQGLAISRDVVVAKHGGRLEVDGEEGVGAIFRVWLPLDGEDL